MKTFYTHARIFRNGGFATGRLVVEEGRVVADGDPQPGDRVVDLGGLSLVPGLVDVHVHLREPGFPQKETIASGTAAAAAGGYTTVCSMPNLNPAPDTVEHLGEQLAIIRRDAAVRVVPYGTITLGQRGCGELADFAALAPYVVGFSDDGRGVQSGALMEEAMRRAAAVGKPIVAHCALAERTGCQYHVCHVSTKESVALVREAKARGLRVSCETGPHYLLLCDEQLQEEGRFKMNPPLRSRADREALLEGIADGTIEVVATDHAPHTAEEKSRGLAGSAMGIVGLETAFPLLYKYLVCEGVIGFDRLMALMSANPRRIFGLGGGVEPGQEADFTVLDLDARYEIDPAAFRSKGRATPFAGWEVQGRAVLTVVGGREVFDVMPQMR